MKRLFIIILISLSLYACKSGNDQFAVYTGGSIIRTEFNEWLESRNMSVDLVYRDKYAMGDFIRQIAVEKLTSEIAEKSNYDKDRLYLQIEKTLYKNLLSTFYSAAVKEDITFTDNAVDISIIRLFINDGGRILHVNKQNKKKLIRQIISELNSGADFNFLAKKYSEDSLSSKDGHLGIIPESLLEKEIVETLSFLKENEYTKKPVILKGAICLIKLHGRHIITEKNIRNIINDKKNIERILDYYNSKALDELRLKSSGNKNITSNIDKASFRNKNEILFSIDGEIFTTEELYNILNLFFLLRNGYLPVAEFTLKEMKTTAEKIFRERIIALEASIQGIDFNSKFKLKWHYLKRAALAALYKYNIFIKDINFTEKDILQEYLRNKDKKYYKIERRKNKEKKIYLSYREAKNNIRSLLAREKLKSLKKSWDDNILADNNYILKLK